MSPTPLTLPFIKIAFFLSICSSVFLFPSSSFCTAPEQTVSAEWKHLRKQIFNKGVQLETTNITDFLTNLIRDGGPKGLIPGEIDLKLTLDAEQLVGWKDATIMFYGLGLYGANPDPQSQDAQGFSSILATNDWKLYEAWYQQNFLNDELSFLIGMYEITSEFDVLKTASGLFVHSSFGTNATFGLSGQNGPSTFPTTSLSFRTQWQINDHVILRGVIADGVPGDPKDATGTHIKVNRKDGFLFAGEAAYYQGRFINNDAPTESPLFTQPNLQYSFRNRGREAETPYETKIAFGGWAYSTDFDDLSSQDSDGNPKSRDSTYGLYLIGEQFVFQEKPDSNQGLWVFAQLGWADPRVNQFSYYVGGGLVYEGLLPHRKFDQTGLGFAYAIASSHYKRGQRQQGLGVEDEEVAFELTHAIRILSDPDLIIQPDLQYIFHPNTNPEKDNALVGGFRLLVNVDWFQ